jgi:hypothetical protein
MARVILDRDQQNEIKANVVDHFSILDSFNDKLDLILCTSDHNDALRIKKITLDQLAKLYLEIANVLGKPPEPTLYHLRKIHEIVGKLIQTSEPRESNDFSTDGTGF